MDIENQLHPLAKTHHMARGGSVVAAIVEKGMEDMT